MPGDVSVDNDTVLEPGLFRYRLATDAADADWHCGACAGGPCRGGKLHKLRVIEQDNKVFWEPDEQVRPVLA